MVMPKYIIEREIPGAGNLAAQNLQSISQKSCSVLKNMGPQIRWVQSYVTNDKIYCVYIAPNEEMVGDRVERDEPLFEISTDKVDAEIPSPAAGVLTEIKFKEGETVEVNKVVAVLDGGEGASASNGGASAAEVSAPASQTATAPEP